MAHLSVLRWDNRLYGGDHSLWGLASLEFFYIHQLFDETRSKVLDSSDAVVFHWCLLFYE